MNIRPTQPEGQRGGPDRLENRGVTNPPKRPASDSGAPSLAPDQVRLSDEARGIQGAAETAPAGELSADRMRQVLDRIQQGFYDRPEVVRDTLRALTPALESAGESN